MSAPHGKGLRRTDPAKTAHRLGAELHPAIAAALAAGLKGSGDLSPSSPGVMDQDGSSTCWAHSGSVADYIAFATAGRPKSYVPSPLYFAQCVYSWYRAQNTPAGQPLPALQDGGADLQDAASVFSKSGDIPMQAEQDGRFSDVPDTETTPIPELTPDESQRGSEDLFSGEYSIAVDTNAPTTVAASIDAGIPVWLGTFVDTAFENLTASQVAQPANQNDPNGGGHALVIVGYRTAADGSLEFKVQNSWGTGWCDGGFCWASSAWVLATWELWPFAVAQKAAA